MFETEFAAEAVAGLVTVAVVPCILVPVRVALPAVAELVAAAGAAGAELVQREPAEEALVAVADETAAWGEDKVRGPGETEDSENRIAD